MIKDSTGLRVFHVINFIWLTLLSLMMFIPFLIILSTSFSSETDITLHGYAFLPRVWSLDAFHFVFTQGTAGRGYIISITVTVIGTLLAVIITTMAGYALSRQSLKYRGFFALAYYFTMVFNAGLVPWFIIVSDIGISNSIWAMILPMCFNPFLMLLMRNHFRGIPDSLVESAKIDGAGEFMIYLRIMLPIAIPGVAVITLFYMLAYWNDWWMALLFIKNKQIYPLQFLLRQILANIQFAAMNPSMVNLGAIPQETVKMATCVVTIGPIIFVYPFIQRYFVKGITIGAVKG